MKKDIITKEYMSDNIHFADIFNFFLYDGKEVINPSLLVELDTTQVFHKNQTFIEKNRDILKQLIIKNDNNITYLLLGIENQTNINYSMVIRNMLYDSLSYQKQVSNIEKKKNNVKIRIEGLTKFDKLNPVITLVIYFGYEKWDGARSLYDLIDINDKSLLKYISNYKLNIIAPNEIKDNDFYKFKTDIKSLLRFIKYSNDKEKLEKIINENNEEYERLNIKTANVINELANFDIKIDEKEEMINMCKAIEDMKKESLDKGIGIGEKRGILIGKEEGILIGKEEGKAEKIKEIILSFHKKGLSNEEISNLLELSIDEVTSIINTNIMVN